jgi:protein-L-isoaspartate(D-aspartate) O-methyltransferase
MEPVQRYLPQALLEQLKPGGKLVIPVGKYSQELMVYNKDDGGRISKKAMFGVMYVPLTTRERQERAQRF